MKETPFKKDMFTCEVVDWDDLWDPPEPDETEELDFEKEPDPFFVLPARPNNEIRDPFRGPIVEDILARRESIRQKAITKRTRSNRRKVFGPAVAQNIRACEQSYEGEIDPAQWQEWAACFGDQCAYCGIANWNTIEHVVPLSRGGRNDIYNVVPSCAGCNSQKYIQQPIAWMVKTEILEDFVNRVLAAIEVMEAKSPT